jgi:translation initiation factor 2 subunit 1
LKKAKSVHTIMKQTAIKLGTPVEQLYDAWGWDLYEKAGFDHALDAFRVAMTDPEIVFTKVKISPEHKAVLLDTINKKMASNPLKIRVDFALTCTTYEGVDVIKEALLVAKHQVNTDGWKVDFKMIAAPNYKIEVVTHRKAEGEQKLKQALEIIKTVMKEKGGHFKQKSLPTIIGANKDEPDTQDLLENMKNRREEQDGDVSGGSSEDEEDNDEGMGDIDIDKDLNVHAVEEDDDDLEEKKE